MFKKFAYNAGMRSLDVLIFPCRKTFFGLAMFWLLGCFSFSTFGAVDTKPAQTSHTFPVSLQLNWHPQFEFAGILAAIKQGYYQKAGIQLNLHYWEPNASVIKQVVKQQRDFGVVYGSVVADYAKGAPLKFVMPNMQVSPMVYISHTPINHWKDLDGKTIADINNLYLKDMLVRLKDDSKHKDKIRYIPSHGTLQDFVDGKFDLYAAFQTNEPYRLAKRDIPFYVVDPKSFGVQGYAGLIVTSDSFARTHPDVVHKFKEATIKGWQYALDHQAQTVDYILENFPIKKSREALLDEANKMERFVRSGYAHIGDIDPAKLQVMASEARESRLISQHELDAFKPSQFIFNGGKIQFTPEEMAYISKKPVIKLATDNNWGPFQFIDKQGHYQGITADYFQLLSEKLGLKFEPTKSKDWNQVVALTKAGKLDVYPCAVPTPDRKKYMQFTKPYLSFPMVLMGKQSMPYVSNYSQLDGLTIASVKGGWSSEYLTKHFPKITILPVSTVKEGIASVIDGRAEAFSGNLGVINFTIDKYGFTGVHIIGQTDQRFDVAIGVQKNNPVLFSILQKGLNSITKQERQAIYSKWIKLEIVKQLDKTQLISIAITVTTIILSMLALLLVYRYQKNKQQDYINQVHELTFASMIDLSDFSLVKVTDSYVKLTGYDKDELLGMNYLSLAAHEMTDAQKEQIIKQVLQGNSWHGELKGQTKQHKEYWVDLTLTPIKNILGKVTHVWATRVDITDKKRVEKLSIEDEMTGLYNRRYFNQVIERELNRAKRQEQPLAVAMLDIDYFKNINDNYGHHVGDEVLVRVADSFKKSFHRGNDFVFRMGGEEFLVLSSFPTREEFKQYLDKFCRDVEAMDIQNKGAPSEVLTVSIGAVFYEYDKLGTSTALYHEVDQKLYKAKEGGRNCVVI